jgi:PiT family inorganic phosphate transporter
MFGLDTTMTVMLILCLVCALAFEFINGFHDTANAVATVIYTNSLKPAYAVVWSGLWNAIGVFGGIGVAIKIISLLPSDVFMTTDPTLGIAMIFALLLTAISWNLGTWYFGIPCSSSHTLIGSILGVGIGYALMKDIDISQGVKWSEASKIGMSLLISPLVGFSGTIMIMYIFKLLIKNKRFFKEVESKKKPDFATRLTLIMTCTLVSFAHGKNDGQKGIGLIILILVAFAPTYFAVNASANKDNLNASIASYQSLQPTISQGLSAEDAGIYKKIDHDFYKLDSIAKLDVASTTISNQYKFAVRKLMIGINKNIKKIVASETVPYSAETKSQLKSIGKKLDGYVNYSPIWVVIMVSLALGLGTMIGWKRIVITIGEKIGKQHLSYAQGASAELVAASTIYAATALALPVSTTQVLSSGIAGSMVASKGVKNLQKKTIKSIALAWILTLPVTILLAMGLFLLFGAII